MEQADGERGLHRWLVEAGEGFPGVGRLHLGGGDDPADKQRHIGRQTGRHFTSLRITVIPLSCSKAADGAAPTVDFASTDPPPNQTNPPTKHPHHSSKHVLL